MYDHNNKLQSPLDSDYLLISPHVLVFRDPKGRLLDQPYRVAVATVAAPNKNGAAREIPQSELDEAMKGRLRRFLYAAARNQYRSLILGAWGCGAFGHDPQRVAGYLYELFFEERMEELFETVVFAVLGGGRNYEAFKQVFGDSIEDCGPDHRLNEEGKGYVEAIRSFPICNHTVDVGKENLGYSQGILADGSPFEAELWQDPGGLRFVSIIIPERPEFIPDSREQIPKEKLVGMKWEQDVSGNYSVLPIGMAIRDIEFSQEELEAYTDYLEEMGIIQFSGALRNGYLRALTDIEGHGLIQDIIFLGDKGETPAACPLSFRPFPTQPQKNHRIVDIKTIRSRK